MGSIRFFDHEDYDFYLVRWGTGYVQVWEDWSQWFSPKKYNWLHFRPIYLEIDYDKLAGEHLEFDFGLMGFNVRFQQFIRDNERGKELEKDLGEMETMEEAHRKEVKRLKVRIKELEKKI